MQNITAENHNKKLVFMSQLEQNFTTSDEITALQRHFSSSRVLTKQQH